MADVAIVIGHHYEAQGAHLTLGDLSISEYQLWKPFARELSLTLEGWEWEGGELEAAYVIERPNPNPDDELAHRINHTGADCAIELHFNASAGRARGTEMLHWVSSSGGKRLASHLHENTVEALGTEPRGLKPQSQGYPFLRDTDMPAVICEPAFGSEREDAWKLLTRQADLMQAYRNAIIAFLRSEPVV